MGHVLKRVGYAGEGPILMGEHAADSTCAGPSVTHRVWGLGSGGLKSGSWGKGSRVKGPGVRRSGVLGQRIWGSGDLGSGVWGLGARGGSNWERPMPQVLCVLAQPSELACDAPV